MSGTLAWTSSLAAVASCFALAAAPGCSSDTGGHGAPGGSSGLGGAGGTGGAGCSAIENVGETITQLQASGAVPAPVGGTIADGTYVLTMDEAYPPVTADVPTHKRITLQIAGTTMDAAIENDDLGAPLLGQATIMTAGTQATITWLCGASGSFQQGYTATATGLVLISPPGEVETYSKR
jgi:hypothetical protein